MAKTSVTCLNCKSEFLKENKELNRSLRKRGRHFCGTTCAIEYRKDEYSPFRSFIRKGKSSTKLHEFSITPDYLKQVWEAQKGICPYTNIKMILPKSSHDHDSFKCLKKASLDRIDSSKGYIKGNVEFVCLAINLGKNNFSKQDMLNFMQEIKKADFKICL